MYREKRKGKGAPPATIPIHPELESVLQKAVWGKTPDAFVFVNPRTKKPYTQESLLRIWHSVRDKLGLDRSLRLYDATRRSLASNLVMRNVEIYKVSKLLGHTNVSTTEGYTQHIQINAGYRKNKRCEMQLKSLEST